jgi:hypothetical protein
MPEDTMVKGFKALMASDDETVADGFLVAAVYARAIRKDLSPQDVVEAVFKAVPTTEAWPAFRQMLLVALEEEADG